MKTLLCVPALRVAGLYALTGILWIAFSDLAVTALATDYANLSGFQTAKGLFYVAATATLLYWFSRRQFRSQLALARAHEQAVTERLREREALLHEIHHRVRNNLQVILGLLSLHPHDERGFADMDRTIRSIALAQDMVTKSPDMSSIRAGDFASRLADSLQEDYLASEASIEGFGDETHLSADLAVSLGILLSEACGNSVRHGGRSVGTPVRIAISIRHTGDTIEASVQDDGPGFPKAILEATRFHADQLGLSIIQAITTQLAGSVSLRNEAGGRLELRLPASARGPSVSSLG